MTRHRDADPTSRASPITLADGEIHLWRFGLTADQPTLESHRQLLSEDERARAQRFLFDRDRRRFIVCRAKQRIILSRYLASPAAELEFDYSERGKPAVCPTQNRSGLYFNISNSNELALCGLTRCGELGVDVEFIRGMKDMLGLAERFFAEREIEELRRLDAREQQSAFFEYWTCKEAILKAAGKGLSFPLNQVVISRSPHRLALFGSEEQEAGRWSLRVLAPTAGYAAAVAGRFRSQNLRNWDFDDPNTSW